MGTKDWGRKRPSGWGKTSQRGRTRTNLSGGRESLQEVVITAQRERIFHGHFLGRRHGKCFAQLRTKP
jgi:hypothetical protein